MTVNLAEGLEQEQRGFARVPIQGQPEYQGGGYFALVIGIEQYKPPLSQLATPVHDAQEIASVLQDQYGFHIQLLLGKDATRINILTALDRYRNTLTTNDSLLIYYAGHGYYDHDADRAYWLPADADSPGSPNHISADDITAAVRVLPSQHVLVVSDSCYSGDLTRDAHGADRTEGKPELIERMLRSRSRTLMTSGGDEPVADGGPDRHSVFAYAFLSALKQERDEEFTATDLFYGPVQQEVAGSSRQTPRYSILRNSNHEFGDFVFIQKRPAAAKIVTPPVKVSETETSGQSPIAPVGESHADSALATPTTSFPHPTSNADRIQAGTGPGALSNVSTGSTHMPAGVDASVVIPGRGFDPFFGLAHGISGKTTLRFGTDAEVRVEVGMLYFFNHGPAVDANGQPVGPVSCDKLKFQSSHINGLTQDHATVPGHISLKVLGRSGEATLYLSSSVESQVESDIERICALRTE